MKKETKHVLIAKLGKNRLAGSASMTGSKRGGLHLALLVGCLLVAARSQAVLLVDNGSFNDAICGLRLASTAISNGVRTADGFTVTGSGDNDLLRYSIAGSVVSPGGSQRSVSAINFFVSLFRTNDRWNTPLFRSIVVPSNADFVNSIGLSASGHKVHKLSFELIQFSQLQNLSPGAYRISIHGEGNGNPLGGDFFRLTSVAGVGVVGNTYYDGSIYSGWSSTTTLGGVFTTLAVNGQLEATGDAPAAISGNINLLNTAGSGGTEDLTWTLTQGSNVYSGTITVSDASISAYSITIPPMATNGAYLLKIKGGTFLSDTNSVLLTGSSITSDFALMNGDIDQDAEVGPSDFEAVVAQFGGTGTADCDNDGEVGPSDFEIIVANFGLGDE